MKLMRIVIAFVKEANPFVLAAIVVMVVLVFLGTNVVLRVTTVPSI